MLLENKNAVIYGGGSGSRRGGGPCLRPRGGEVFRAGRTRKSLEAVAADVTVAGGRAEGKDG